MNFNKGRIRAEQIILHIPHSSVKIPEKYRDLFYLNDDQLKTELLHMTDSYTDELFGIPEIQERNIVIFPYSRLICDVERFRDDRMEPMAIRGMGVCYETTSEMKPLKQVSYLHRTEMLSIYDRHHAVLAAAADRVIQNYGTGLLIDCHSFASKPLPYEIAGNRGTEDRYRTRPDICIGTDPEHTPDWLKESMERAFTDCGYTVKYNYPFSGTLVPMKYYRRNPHLSSIMIEVNRSLYMDESTGEKTQGFQRVQGDIRKIILGLCLQKGM